MSVCGWDHGQRRDSLLSLLFFTFQIRFQTRNYSAQSIEAMKDLDGVLFQLVVRLCDACVYVCVCVCVCVCDIDSPPAE